MMIESVVENSSPEFVCSHLKVPAPAKPILIFQVWGAVEETGIKNVAARLPTKFAVGIVAKRPAAVADVAESRNTATDGVPAVDV